MSGLPETQAAAFFASLAFLAFFTSLAGSAAAGLASDAAAVAAGAVATGFTAGAAAGVAGVWALAANENAAGPGRRERKRALLVGCFPARGLPQSGSKGLSQSVAAAINTPSEESPAHDRRRGGF